jgi:hypothetical protein
MRFASFITILFLFVGGFACRSPQKVLTPMETLELYFKAIKRKDTTQMKLLLSQASLKMAEEEAKAQNVTVDDIVKRETLFSESQTSVKYRNLREQEDTASVEMEDSLGIWNTVHFVKEDGVWKIDKKGFTTQIEQQVQESNEELNRIINSGRTPE